MAASDFFSRWGKAPSSASGKVHAEPVRAPKAGRDDADVQPPPEPLPPPTLEDVSSLTQESDFSRFVGKDVDDAVKRSAMKKLFSNPHFNIMDGLDIYIDDYNQFTPLTPAMLASLNHAKDLLDPPGLKRQDQHASDEEQGKVAHCAERDEEVPAEGESSENEDDSSDSEDGSLNEEGESSCDLPDMQAEDVNGENQHLSQGGQ